MLPERERFLLQYLLGKLNESAEVVAGAQVTVPEENIKEMQEARVRNLSNQDRQEIISEIKQELMITDSFLTTSSNQQEFPGDGKLV